MTWQIFMMIKRKDEWLEWLLVGELFCSSAIVLLFLLIVLFECGTSILRRDEEKEEKGRKVIKIRTTATEDMRHLRCG